MKVKLVMVRLAVRQLIGLLCFLSVGAIVSCTPAESQPSLTATHPVEVTETAVLATATMIPTTAVFPLTATPPPTTSPDATPTPTQFPRVSVSEPPTRIYLPTSTPYPFERPAACFPPAERPENYPEDYKMRWKACTDLLTSPDGEWTAVLVGPDFCGFNVGLYHGPTEEFTIYEYGGAKYYEFLSDNRLLVQFGSCSNAWMDILDPVTGESVRLGDSGFAPSAWNEARTTFITIIGGWEVNNYFAVYNVETNRTLFRGALDPNGLVFWIEDPTYLLYEVGDYTLHYSSEYYNEEYQLGPRQLYRVSLETRTADVIIDDLAHSYYLIECPEDEAGNCTWPQDWIRVRRVPYVAEDFYRWSGSSSGETNWECIARGIKCSQSAETIWLNWRTGEIDDEETSTLVPSPTPTLPGW